MGEPTYKFTRPRPAARTNTLTHTLGRRRQFARRRKKSPPSHGIRAVLGASASVPSEVVSIVCGTSDGKDPRPTFGPIARDPASRWGPRATPALGCERW